ncbi:hypothetical protein ABZ671_28260 [Micromonospora sp. NPDC006766]|uniref:hypothetical protein n=1 Tax=Micromonospora sp. NPDC006766 TaxID=3154778 RepID=UPI0033BFF8C8
MAGPVVWLTGLADDRVTLRRQTVERPTHSVEANLRNQERGYAWTVFGALWAFGGMGVVVSLEPVVGKAVADALWGAVLYGLVLSAVSAGLSGLRAMVAGRWGWLVFPGDAADKKTRLRLRQRRTSPNADDRWPLRLVRRVCQPWRWDPLVAAIVAIPFYFAGVNL